MNEAAIFDMDGVLVDSYHAHYESWLEVVRSVGMELSEEQFVETFGRTNRDIIGALWVERGRPRPSDAEIDELGDRKEAAYRRIIEVRFPAMPGAVELLHQLHDSGFRLAVGSSGPEENISLVLGRMGIRDLMEAVVTGREVTRGKPDPQVFLLAASRLGVPPRQCVVTEDAPAGIAAARAAGMAAVGLASTGHTRESLAAADLVVDRLDELSPQRLRELIARIGVIPR